MSFSLATIDEEDWSSACLVFFTSYCLFFQQRQILQLQPSSLKKSPSLWGKRNILQLKRCHATSLVPSHLSCTEVHTWQSDSDRAHDKAVPVAPSLFSSTEMLTRKVPSSACYGSTMKRKKKKKRLTGNLIFWRICCYFLFQSLVSLPLLFRNFQVIDNQRKLTQLSHRLEPRKTAWQ